MSESLKIAFYTDTFLPAVDGVVTSILGFKKELENRGHEVYIFASGTEKTKQMTKNDKRIFVVKGIRLNKYPQYSFALFPLATTLKLGNVKMDVHHAHTPFSLGVHAYMMSKLDRAPLVGTFHTLFTDSAIIKEYAVNNEILAKSIIKYSWKYISLFYNRCDEVTAPSNVIKHMLEKNDVKNVKIIPGGVDMKKFNPKVNGGSIRKELTRGGKGKIVMYVGRISREKKIETLIKAAGLLKKENIRFVIAGTGPAYGHYTGMVERMHLNDKVRFVGFVKNDDLPKYYAACDAFCIPSTFETQGVVSLEAMASGKPVIGADYLALKELIKNGKNGEKFKPGNSMDCSKKIRKVLYNIDTYKEMVDTAKKYSIERTTDDLLDLYKRVINH